MEQARKGQKKRLMNDDWAFRPITQPLGSENQTYKVLKKARERQ